MPSKHAPPTRHLCERALACRMCLHTTVCIGKTPRMGTELREAKYQSQGKNSIYVSRGFAPKCAMPRSAFKALPCKHLLPTQRMNECALVCPMCTRIA